MFSTWFRWSAELQHVKGMVSRRGRRTRAGPRRFRPQLEILEDRLTPAPLVTTSMDGNFAGTLRFAINNSNPLGDTVDVPDNLGVYNLTLGALSITHNLTVQNGGPGAANPIIDGQANDRVFIITGSNNITANFTGLTIRNGLTSGGGGGVEYAVAVGAGTGQLNFTNCLVTNNKSTGLQDGGGILTFGEPVSLNNTTVSFNNATGTGTGSEGGGGINTEGGSVTLTHNSHVDHNTTAGFFNGGGILTGIGNPRPNPPTTPAGNVTVTDSTVDFNMATGVPPPSTEHGSDAGGGGGGINSGQGSVILTRSHVDHNTAAGTDGGGGILQEGHNNVTLTNSTVSFNTATNPSGAGGGIECQGGVVTLTNSSVNNNNAMGLFSAGGGIDDQGGAPGSPNINPPPNVILMGSHVDNNRCAGLQNGGGIDSEGRPVSLTDSTVDCNIATGSGSATDQDGSPEFAEGGGGINTEGGTVTLLRSHVDGNSSAGLANGGGIFTDGSNRATATTYQPIMLTDSTVDWNVATGSGTIKENNTVDSSGGGGGISTGGSDLVLVRSHIDHNTAAGLSEGGGAFTDGGNVTLTDSTMDENSSTATGTATGDQGEVEFTQGGGAIDSGGGTVTLMGTTGSHVDFNTSAGLGGGGGIDSQGGDVTLTNSTVIGNKATATAAPTSLGVEAEDESSLPDSSEVKQEEGNGSGVVETESSETIVFSSEGGGGINTEGGNVSLDNSTVSCNSSQGFLGGGGILALGNSDPSGGGTGSVTGTNNSQVNRNTASAMGGGIVAFSVSLDGVTVARNSAADCGGLDLTGAGSTINNSVVAGNSGSPHPNICGNFTGTGNTIGSTPPVEPPVCPSPPVIPNPCQGPVIGQFKVYYGDHAYRLGGGNYGQLFTFFNTSNMDLGGPVTITFPTLTVPIVSAQSGNGPAVFTPNSITLTNGIPAGKGVTVFIIFFNPNRVFLGHAWLGIPVVVTSTAMV